MGCVFTALEDPHPYWIPCKKCLCIRKKRYAFLICNPNSACKFPKHFICKPRHRILLYYHRWRRCKKCRKHRADRRITANTYHNIRPYSPDNAVRISYRKKHFQHRPEFSQYGHPCHAFCSQKFYRISLTGNNPRLNTVLGAHKYHLCLFIPSLEFFCYCQPGEQMPACSSTRNYHPHKTSSEQ